MRFHPHAVVGCGAASNSGLLPCILLPRGPSSRPSATSNRSQAAAHRSAGWGRGLRLRSAPAALPGLRAPGPTGRHGHAPQGTHREPAARDSAVAAAPPTASADRLGGAGPPPVASCLQVKPGRLEVSDDGRALSVHYEASGASRGLLHAGSCRLRRPAALPASQTPSPNRLSPSSTRR